MAQSCVCVSIFGFAFAFLFLYVSVEAASREPWRQPWIRCKRQMGCHNLHQSCPQVAKSLCQPPSQITCVSLTGNDAQTKQWFKFHCVCDFVFASVAVSVLIFISGCASVSDVVFVCVFVSAPVFVFFLCLFLFPFLLCVFEFDCSVLHKWTS